MNDLRGLLSRYANLGFSERKKKEAVAEAILNHFQITIKPSQVVLHETEVQLHVASSIRFAVLGEKKSILEAIAKKLNSAREITNIR